MSMFIKKESGVFAVIGDKVSLTVPPASQDLALRLYEKTLEIAIFSLVDEAVPLAGVTRTFQAIDPAAPLPTTYMKYIGTIGLPVIPPTELPTFVAAYIIEVTS